MNPRAYVVTSAPYLVREWVCEYGGPTYNVRESVVVVAATAKEAKWRAARSTEFMRAQEFVRDDGLHPLSGMTAERLPDDTDPVQYAYRSGCELLWGTP